VAERYRVAAYDSAKKAIARLGLLVAKKEKTISRLERARDNIRKNPQLAEELIEQAIKVLGEMETDLLYATNHQNEICLYMVEAGALAPQRNTDDEDDEEEGDT
jgi:hypothetical protein